MLDCRSHPFVCRPRCHHRWRVVVLLSNQHRVGWAVTSELQRDIEFIDKLASKHAGPVSRRAWQRIRQRLTPDREVIARGMFEAEVRRRGVEPNWEGASPMIKNGWYEVANAAIDAARGEAVAFLYTLEYGSSVADRRVSPYRLNYPFGVCGADYQRSNEDGVSYVRETPLYAAPPAAAVPTPPPAGIAVVPEMGRDSVLNSAKFRASCYTLVGIVEGIQGLGRCWAANGERLKDTREWVAFYNSVSAMRNGNAEPTSATQAPPAAVPAGYVPVPVEPTQGMLDAAGMCIVPDGKEWLDQSNRETWAAMLAAAPAPNKEANRG